MSNLGMINISDWIFQITHPIQNSSFHLLSLYMKLRALFLDFCSKMFNQIFLKDIIEHINVKNIDID